MPLPGLPPPPKKGRGGRGSTDDAGARGERGKGGAGKGKAGGKDPTSRPPLIRKANIAAAKDHGSERGIAEPPIVKNSRGVKARVNMMCMSRMRSGPEARPGLGWL